MSSRVILKSGHQLSESTVATTMEKLEELHKKDYSTFMDLVELCRNPSYDPRSIYIGPKVGVIRLKEKGFIDQSERVSDVVKRVLLSSVEGDGGCMRLTNPVVRRAEGMENHNELLCYLIFIVAAVFVLSLDEFSKRYFR